MTKATGSAWVGYALAYGGVVQLLAAMWEFRNKNVFGTTVFGSYGGFWIGLGLWVLLVERNAPASPVLKAVYLTQLPKDVGWILLGFAIFNTYMLLISTQTNVVIFSALLFLEATLIILFIGNFMASTGTIKAGGYVGVATALIAWYGSAAGVTNGLGGRLRCRSASRSSASPLRCSARSPFSVATGPGGTDLRDRFAFPGPGSRRAVPPAVPVPPSAVPVPSLPGSGPSPLPPGPCHPSPRWLYRPSPAGPIP